MRAKKHLGQNFLKSEAALQKIIGAGEIGLEDTILEIGPGRGALTERLLRHAGTVIAVEKDMDLVEFLQDKFEKEIREKKLILINEDILEFKIAPKNYKLIANIPYNITGAILKKFLTAKNQPERMILMVQYEVAKRIMGRVGPASTKASAGKKESILSISVKAYGQPKMLMKVPARYFSPAPKVDSAVIAITNISRKNFRPLPGLPLAKGEVPKAEGVDEEKFWEIVKAGFAHKRKKLSSNLKEMLKKKGRPLPEELRDKRAEDLSLSDWFALF